MILTKNLKNVIKSMIAVTFNLSMYTILYHLQNILYFFTGNKFEYLFESWQGVLLIDIPRYVVGVVTLMLIIQLLSRISSFVFMDVLLYTEDDNQVQPHQSTN